MKDLNFYIDMYKDYLKIESRKELKEHQEWLITQHRNKNIDLIILRIVCENEKDKNKVKLRNEITDLEKQIEAIKIVLEELK